MYSVDDLVVYPAQGVGKINGIDSKLMGGAHCDFYSVRIQHSNITLIVPVKNAQNVGLRRLVTKDTAASILDALRNGTEKSVYVGQNWNRRFREYTDKMKSSDLNVVAGVLHELLVIGRSKELSFGERRLKDQAMALVAGELAEVLGMSEASLRRSLAELYSPLPPPQGSASPSGKSRGQGKSVR